MGGTVTSANRETIVRLAAQHRLPAVYAFRYYVTSGGLLSPSPCLRAIRFSRPQGRCCAIWCMRYTLCGGFLLLSPRRGSPCSRWSRTATCRRRIPAYLLTLLRAALMPPPRLVRSGRSWLIASTGRRFGVLRTARFTEPCCSFPSPHAKTAIDCAFRSRWKDYRILENGHMSHTCSETWHLDLQDLLGLGVPLVAIAFISHVPTGIGRIQRTIPPATTDGRTGAVAASCVFWIEGTVA